MTEEEYIIRLSALKKEELEARAKYNEAKRNVKQLEKEYSSQLAENYTDYIGEKVIIYYKNKEGKEYHTQIGYLDRFVWVDNNCYVDVGLYPFLLKVKKDGSKSKAPFSEWDNTQAEVKRIIRIEKI